MRSWLRHHALSFAQTMRRLAASPVASLLNALVIGVALALPLGGYLLLANLQPFARALVTDAQISVFLAPDASKSDITEIDRRLRGTPGVTRVEFVGREQALAGLKRTPGMAEVVATLRDNPLPDAFVVTLAANEPGLAQRLEQEAEHLCVHRDHPIGPNGPVLQQELLDGSCRVWKGRRPVGIAHIPAATTHGAGEVLGWDSVLVGLRVELVGGGVLEARDLAISDLHDAHRPQEAARRADLLLVLSQHDVGAGCPVSQQRLEPRREPRDGAPQ